MENMTLEPFKNKDEIEFKPSFKERYEKLTDWETFAEYCLSFLRRSIRINTLKTDIQTVKKSLEAKGWMLDPVPWCKEAFFIKHKEGRRDAGNTIEHQLGYFYIQEAASMIPPLVLDPQPGEKVLDAAASPGSKTSQMAQMMKNEGIIIANDPASIRMAPLSSNLTRLGVTNTIMTIMKGQQFRKFENFFDKILLDAPCSGSGTIRKSPKTIRMWNPRSLKGIVNVQRELICAAYKALKPNGVMVYSTCSLEPEENEGLISWFLEKEPAAKLESFSLPGLKQAKAIEEFGGEEYHKDISKVCRLWPQDNDTEGFFIAKIRKV